MEQILIKAETRTGTGKGAVKKLRESGSIPAVLYGKDVKAVPIAVITKEWQTLMKHVRRNAILTMELHGGGGVDNRPVMVKDIQRGFLGDKVLHIDFLQVSMERTVQIEIPLHLTGDSQGVTKGGIVEQHLRTIMVECLPTQIPEVIDIDIAGLDIGDSFHVHQISISGVKLLEGGDVAIVTITPPTVEEAAPAAPVEEAEVEKKEEKEE